MARPGPYHVVQPDHHDDDQARQRADRDVEPAAEHDEGHADGHDAQRRILAQHQDDVVEAQDRRGDDRGRAQQHDEQHDDGVPPEQPGQARGHRGAVSRDDSEAPPGRDRSPWRRKKPTAPTQSLAPALIEHRLPPSCLAASPDRAIAELIMFPYTGDCSDKRNYVVIAAACQAWSGQTASRPRAGKTTGPPAQKPAATGGNDEA